MKIPLFLKQLFCLHFWIPRKKEIIITDEFIGARNKTTFICDECGKEKTIII